jgi:hypothetical protein
MGKNITILLLVFGVVTLVCTSASAFSFDDIQIWAGSGSNRAGIVIDWNDGNSPVSLAWGFRWDGTATGRDMLNAIKAVDSRLFEAADPEGRADIYGIGYDLDNDGFNYVPGDDDTGYAADSDDHYNEGWTTAGYWSYFIKPSASASWGWAMEGLTTRVLTDGGWDGWSFAPAPNWDSGAPDAPVAAIVPEPGSLLAMVSGLVSLGGLAYRRRMG